ncbi:MAG TPA: hypothetical protein VGI12_22700 [Vicinamibacterales bacterium]
MRAGFAVALSLVCGTLVFAQKKGDQKPDAATSQQQAQNQEISTVMQAADAAMATPPASSDIPIQVQTDFLKAMQGRIWVPLTLTIDPTKVQPGPVTLYVRVAPRGMATPAPPTAPVPDPAAAKDSKKKPDKNDKSKDKNAAPAPAAPSYPYEDVTFMELKPPAAGMPFRIQRGIGVPSGSYDLYVVLHDRASGGKLGVLRQPLEVPNYSTGELMTSSIILAQHVNQLTAPVPTDQQSEHPYAFGQTEIEASSDRKFKKSDELIVLFQIYNANVTAEKKFSLEATYTFYKQDAGGEKRFNSTEPQPLNNDTMPPGFDPTSGSSSIQAGQGIPLQSFGDGNYRLEIKITDKQNGKVLTQSTTFTVAP